MATYQELYTEYGNNTLIERITIAILIAADSIINELPATTGHAERVIWAQTALRNPESQAKHFWGAVLAANNAATITTIQNATDTALQNNINAAVNTFAGVTV